MPLYGGCLGGEPGAIAAKRFQSAGENSKEEKKYEQQFFQVLW